MPILPTWIKISMILSIFGFLKEFRPSEPYIFEYLTNSQWRNLSAEVVQQDVYPVGTYSYMALLIFVFLITDFWRYKPLITLSTISGIIIWVLLLWTSGLFAVQVVEVFYGFFMAAEVAYYTYIYAKVPKENYQVVTSCTRFAVLAGQFTSAVTAQCFVYFQIMDMKQLNYLTLAAMVLGTLWSFLLPSVPQSLYFNKPETINFNFVQKSKLAFHLLWSHTKISYTKFSVIKWSLWWALATCGFIQVENYIQPLWQTLIPEGNEASEKNIYNAAVTATLTLLGATMAVLAGTFTINWSKYGETALALCSTIGGCALLVCAMTTNIWICYAGYIVFGVLYQLMITVASFQVASDIPEDSYGLIFGINTLLALVFQTILLQIVVSDNGFALKPHKQYLVYGGYHIVIGLIFITFFFIKQLTSYLRQRKQPREPNALSDDNSSF